jgi:spore coat protein H
MGIPNHIVENDRRPHRPARGWAAAALLAYAVLSGCREDPLGLDESTGRLNPDWTEATHGRVSPAYSVVFPQDSVNRIEITMTAAGWASVRADMVRLWGFDFGSGGAGPGGGGGGFPAIEPAYIPVTVRFNGKQWTDVGYRLKGNSSLSSAWRQGNYKLPFRLNFDRFEDSIPDIDNQRFYGFKELSMSSGFGDNSLIREKVAADIFNLAGIPAARTALYSVYVDFGQGLKYAGVYVMVEVIDDTMVDDRFGADDGNIYKPESRFQTFVATQFEKKNNELVADYSDVQSLITALNNPLRTTDPARWRAGLEAALDVDHFLRWLAVNNAMVNWDTYGAIAHNFYLFDHPARDLVWIPWDHNQSLSGSPGIKGTTTGGPGGGGAGPGRALSLTMNEVNATWPLIRYLADEPVYFERYRAHMKTFREEVFTEARMNALFEKYHAMAAPFAVGPSGEQPGYTYLQGPAAFTGALELLRAHVRARRALVAQFAP